MPDGIAAEVKGAVKFGRNEPVTVTAKPGDRFTFAVMFGQSNDLFYAPKGGSMALFDKAGRPILGDRTAEVALYDAGTEVNQVPGVGPDQGPRQKTRRQGELEQACVVGGRALDQVGRLRSRRGNEYILEFRKRLAPYAGEQVVRDFDARVKELVGSRP